MRLLLVEDDEDIAETLVAFLEKHGFVVDLAETLAIAEDALFNGEFDLVLLDRVLPDGDGVSLIAYANSRNRPQRFLLLTALGDIDDRVGALESGADDYISKPFEPRACWPATAMPCAATANDGEVKQFGAGLQCREHHLHHRRRPLMLEADRGAGSGGADGAPGATGAAETRRQGSMATNSQWQAGIADTRLRN
jgi:DNA-binding NtrC family response regulator